MNGFCFIFMFWAVSLHSGLLNIVIEGKTFIQLLFCSSLYWTVSLTPYFPFTVCFNLILSSQVVKGLLSVQKSRIKYKILRITFQSMWISTARKKLLDKNCHHQYDLYIYCLLTALLVFLSYPVSIWLSLIWPALNFNLKNWCIKLQCCMKGVRGKWIL